MRRPYPQTGQNGRVTDVDRLYAVPLENFVAERKQVAKELRAAGEREAAAEVAKLPKPTPPAWALNRLARDDPEAVAEWLDAAAALREASANPGAGLREAMSEHRDATRKLIAAARDRTRPGGRALSEPMLERVRELLQAATADPEQAEALRRGTIVESGGDEEAPEPLARAAAGGGGGGADRGSRRAGKERVAEDKEERKARERAERVAELERLVSQTEDQLAQLREDASERAHAAATADERLDEARRTLHRSESEAAAAHDAADEAKAAVATAERELKQLERQLRNASS
jgi:DNA repair exonuclease SbcCD ATPase subunit